MSERRSSADLGSNAETALANLPFPERDWESSARAVDARLADSVRGTTDEALLSAPFPSEPGEPSALSATSTPLANSGVRTQSLAELARRSVEKKHAGEREVARASLQIAAQSRPSGEEARALREVVSQRVGPAPAPPPSAPSAVRPVVAAAPSAAIHAAPTRPSALPKIAIAASVLAIAAVLTLWLRKPETQPLAMAPAAAPPTRTQARTESLPKPAVETEQSAPGVDLNSLPREEAAPLAATDAPRAKPIAGSALVAAPSSKPTEPKIELEEEAPAAPVAAAEKPVEKSLPPDPALRPADSKTGEMPVKPSTGAVQAALGSVMSGARHCVAGDEAPSSAVVVFGSDGRVQSVSVSGPAAGKASAGCIQSQLSRARVQPFAQSSFSVNATVRPD